MLNVSNLNQLNTLNGNGYQTNERCLLTLSKRDNQIIDDQTKGSCKILKFSSEWKFDEILDEISKLDAKVYPNLSIFVIGDANFELMVATGREKKIRLDVESLKEHISRFSRNCSMFLQLTSTNDCEPKFYHKIKNSEQFFEKKSEDFVEMMDDQLLNLLVDQQKVNKNSQVVGEICEKFFKIHYKPRKLIKNCQINAAFSSINGLVSLKLEIMEDAEHPYIARPLSTIIKEEPFVAKIKTEPGCEEESNYWNSIAVNEIFDQPKIKTEENLKSEEMTQEEMLEDVKNKRFVLISDKAGSGKSWVLKSFTKLLKKKYPEKWTTCVDLKQFINEFKTQNTELEFASFVVEKILKPKTNFEAEIFKKLYKNGKVCILFDGFDEIVPNCAEFVTKLFQSFQQNGQNQLWIATRDNFEVNLKDELKLDAVYKLDELTEKPKFELIASWRNLLQVEVRKNKCIEFHEKMWEIIREYFDSPEILDIIKHTEDNADNILQIAVENNTNEVVELTWNEIKNAFNKYDGSGLKKYLMHVNQNGETILHVFIKQKDVEKLKFLFSAIKFYFHSENLSKQFKELINQKTSLYKENILHYAANCNNPEFHETLWELLLNTFENRAELTDLIMQRNENGSYFIHNLVYNPNPDLIELTLKKLNDNLNRGQYGRILKSKGQYGRNLLQHCSSNDKKALQIVWKKLQIFCKSDEEFLKFLKEVDNYNNNVFHQAALFSTSDMFEFMIKELEKIASREEIRKILSTLGLAKRNLLQSAEQTNKSLEFHQNLWKTIQIYFNSFEIFDMMKHTDDYKYTLLQIVAENNVKEVVELTWNQVKNIFAITEDPGLLNYIQCVNFTGENILHALIKESDEKKLKYFWKELEDFFASQNASQQFKRLASAKTRRLNQNVLHVAPKCVKLEFHETLWEILLKTFENREELKELIMQGDKYVNGNNFVYQLIIHDNLDVIQLAFKKFNEHFTHFQYEQILKLKDGRWKRNLLQQAAILSKDIKTHQILWKIMRDFCKTDEEFLEFLKEVDSQDNNVFHLAACFTSGEIFEFMVNQLAKITPHEKIISHEKIREILSILGQSNKNLLQSAARQNESPEFHQSLWKIIRKNFNSSEIFEMIKHADDFGNNFLQNAVGFNIKEICEFTWNEVKKNFLQFGKITQMKLKELVMQTDKNGNNFVHFLVIRNAADITEFGFKMIKEEFKVDYQEILRLKGSNGRNLLHIAACQIKDIKLHQFLWKTFRDFCKSDDEFLKILKEVDNDDNNVFHVAACFTKSEIFEFMVQILEKMTSLEGIREMLSTLGIARRNLLQNATRQNQSLEFQQILWKIIQKYFYSSEILLMIKHIDTNGDNLLTVAVQRSTEETVGLMFQKINNILSVHEKIGLVACLRNVNRKGRNIFHVVIEQKSSEKLRLFWKEFQSLFSYQNCSKELISQKTTDLKQNSLQLAAYCDKIEFHEALWEILLKTYENREELMELMLQNNIYGNNFTHVIVIFATSDVIEFSFRKIKEIFSDEQYQKILKLRGYQDKNLIQLAAWATNDIKLHQILWKIILDSCRSNEEFLGILQKVDDEKNNIFHIAASHSTNEVFEFMVNQLEKITSLVEIRKILSTLGHLNRNLLQSTVINNKSIEFQISLWKIAQKYFSSSEIRGMFAHTDELGDNIFDSMQNVMQKKL